MDEASALITLMLTLAVTNQILQVNTFEEYLERHDFYLGTQDFSALARVKSFIDKSLLIKEIFDDLNQAILLTAPSGFGKTVNMNMLASFLEIAVDEKGNEIVNKSLTANYNLFTGLKIYKNHRKFFDRNFGKYPVVHINYHKLSSIDDYQSMLDIFKKILLDSFLRHKYLFFVENFWNREHNFDFEIFKNYASYGRSAYLNETNIQTGFEFLFKVLHRYFKRKVFILVDEYDRFVDKLLFYRAIKDTDRIIEFLRDFNGRLIEESSTQYVEKVLFTGITRFTAGFKQAVI